MWVDTQTRRGAYRRRAEGSSAQTHEQRNRLHAFGDMFDSVPAAGTTETPYDADPSAPRSSSAGAARGVEVAAEASKAREEAEGRSAEEGEESPSSRPAATVGRQPRNQTRGGVEVDHAAGERRNAGVEEEEASGACSSGASGCG